MALLLTRSLIGLNQIVEVNDDIGTRPGVMKSKDFLLRHGLYNHDGALELAQVLKISLKDLVKLDSEGGYISGDAQNNIAYYLQSGRLSHTVLSFLQRQQGNCGQLNGEEK